MAPPSPTGSNGRNNSGQFAPGNAYGRGNPHARRVAALRTALLDAITPDALTGIINGLINAATCGDVAACKLLLSYAIGQPTPAVDPDRLDHLEWELAKAMPTKLDLLMREIQGQ